MRPIGSVVAASLGLAAASFTHAQTLDVVARATSNSSRPAQISGPLPVMTVSNAGICNGTEEATCRSFVAFDLSPLRSSPAVDHAILRLWVTGVVAPGTVEVVPVLDPWREDALTADSSPTLGSPVASFDIASRDAERGVEVDVTTLVRDWASGALPNHGLALVASGDANVVFDTRSGRPPELEVGVPGDTTPIGAGLANVGGEMSAAGWTATTTYTAPWPRAYHSAVWTGSRMIVWGGMGSSGLPFFTGGLYDPVTDSWTPTTIVDAPSGRDHHTAVWTGTRMIVWGGYDSTGPVVLRTGGQYDPASDSWTTTAITTAPSAREHHTAVWTGSRMIVWGGLDANGNLLSNGSQYDPASDSWTPIGTGGAPSPRYHHTAVWTGSHMVIWGGSGNGSDGLDTGGRYDPVAGSWTPTATTGAPSARWWHTGVWTGSRMIVWGGFGSSTKVLLNTGGRYDPATDTWAPTTIAGAPAPRVFHTAVQAGTRMIVWGGVGIDALLNTGGEYFPTTNSWLATGVTGAPSVRYHHSAVWTGSRMTIWGGIGPGFLHTGGRYQPSFTRF